jgi:hypothetical protein
VITKKKSKLIDVEISGKQKRDKEAEKILKHKDLAIEIQHLWNVKTNVIPAIIEVTGTISKSFRKYTSNVPGKHKIKNYRKEPLRALQIYFGKY